MNWEVSTSYRSLVVIPANAGIQVGKAAAVPLDPRFRGGDDNPL
jgi:hypothetical protein